MKSKEKLHSIEIFEKIIKEFNIDSKRKYMEVYEDSKELGLPPLSKLSQIYPEWEGWNKLSPEKKSDRVKKEIRKIQEDLNEVGGSEEELEEKNSPTKKEKKIVQKKNLAPYEELKKIVKDQRINLAKDYRLFREKNGGVFNGRRMPSEPNRYYGDEWKGWGEFLWKLPIAPYEELKKIARDQGIKTSRDYHLLREENEGVINGWGMPRNPNRRYVDEWEGWGVFLGKKSSPPFASYEELKKILIDQGIKTSIEYFSWREKNKGVFNGRGMPRNPNRRYVDEWKGWNEFLGKKISSPFASYEELKKISRDQGIKTSIEYFSWREKNKGVFNGRRIPSNPHTYYDEWKSWPEFLNKCETAFKEVGHR